jgi:hypothetical protein
VKPSAGKKERKKESCVKKRKRKEEKEKERE